MFFQRGLTEKSPMGSFGFLQVSTSTGEPMSRKGKELGPRVSPGGPKQRKRCHVWGQREKRPHQKIANINQIEETSGRNTKVGRRYQQKLSGRP